MLCVVRVLGDHHWGALSDGQDCYKGEYEHITPLAFDVNPIPGSNETYCFKGTKTADANSTTVAHKFMQCHCVFCRQNKECPDRKEMGAWLSTTQRKKANASRRSTRAMADDLPCAHCGDTKDEA